MTTRQSEMIRLYRRYRDLSKTGSFGSVMTQMFDKIQVYMSVRQQRNRFRGRSFTIFGQHLPYFIHHYNATWRNERCVEIAVANAYLNRWDGLKVLELGNVMSYYRNHRHLVVDKYERMPGVRNVDFLDLELDDSEKPDAFISISTFEHIGRDEQEPQDLDKVVRSMERIGDLVKDREKVLVTFPLGYHEKLDELARHHQLPFKRQTCLVRQDLNQTWMELPPAEGVKPFYRYGAKFPGANACFFGLGI